MKGRDIFDSIGELSDDVIEKNKTYRKKYFKRNKIIVAVAACLVLAVGIGFLIPYIKNDKPVFPGFSFLDPIPSNEPTAPRYSDGTVITGVSDKGREEYSLGNLLYKYSDGISVCVKVKEVLPDVYRTFDEYLLREYKMYRMEVIDPLSYGIDGEFWYGMPVLVNVDLKAYDTLIITYGSYIHDQAMKNCSTNVVEAFDATTYWDGVSAGSIVAFNDGVYDPGLWEKMTEQLHVDLVVTDLYEKAMIKKGMTLEEAIDIYKEEEAKNRTEERIAFYRDMHIDDYKTEEEKEVKEYVKQFKNGIFRVEQLVIGQYGLETRYTRYINGCPTNEYIDVIEKTGEVEYPEFRFEKEDMQDLPDIAGYLEKADLDELATDGHEDPAEARGQVNTANCVYEKAESGVYGVIYTSHVYFYTDQFVDMTYTEDYRTYLLFDMNGVRKLDEKTMQGILGDRGYFINHGGGAVYIPDNGTIGTEDQWGSVSDSLTLTGTAAKEQGTPEKPHYSEPQFALNTYDAVMYVKVKQVLEDSYQTLYCDVMPKSCKMYLMEVIDPLTYGFEGEFWYAMPVDDGIYDLTKYDTLLLSLGKRENKIPMKNERTGTVRSFDRMYIWYNSQCGKIMPFTNGVFDESLWREMADHMAENKAAVRYDFYSPDGIIESPTMTAEEAIAKYDRIKKLYEGEELKAFMLSLHYQEYENEKAKEAYEYVTSFENGVFVNTKEHGTCIWFMDRRDEFECCDLYTRYINGCPTNEGLYIYCDGETVFHRPNKFDENDIKSLPDIAAYIEKLDLEKEFEKSDLPENKTFYRAYTGGKYVKNEGRVYGLVRITFECDQSGTDTYSTYILFENGTVKKITSDEYSSLECNWGPGIVS